MNSQGSSEPLELRDVNGSPCASNTKQGFEKGEMPPQGRFRSIVLVLGERLQELGCQPHHRSDGDEDEGYRGMGRAVEEGEEGDAGYEPDY